MEISYSDNSHLIGMPLEVWEELHAAVTLPRAEMGQIAERRRIIEQWQDAVGVAVELHIDYEQEEGGQYGTRES